MTSLRLVFFLTAVASTLLAAPPQGPPAVPAAVAPSFAGEFAGDGIALELVPGAKEGAYSGTLTFQGQRYPCSGTAKGATLDGRFTADGAEYRFVLTRRGDEATLVSDGSSYTLRAQAAPPQGRNPLAGGADPARAKANGEAATGGVGIAFRLDDAAGWVIEQVAPGGSASKQHLRPGMVLHAVDGKSVRGLSREQVRTLCTGPVGSMVTLTVETKDEVLDVVVQRAPLPGQGPALAEGAVPGRAPGEANGPGVPARAGGVPAAPAAASLPSWMQTGTRVTFYSGSASLPGVTTTLVEDDQGNWVDQNGRRYSTQDQAGSAGAGYTQYDLAYVGDDGIAAQMNNYVFMDAQLGTTVLTTTQGYVGDRNGLGDVWIHPARLAAMQEQETRGFRVRRLRYPLNGREYDAITTQSTSAGGFMRTTYDLETGLLLVLSSSTVGRSVLTPNPNGTSSTAAGVTTIVSVRLIGVRRLQLPWAQQALPPWLQAGSQWHYRGTSRNSLAEGLLAPWAFEAVIGIDRREPHFATAKVTTRLDYGTGAAPQESASERVVASGLIGGLYVDPAVLERLQEQQVIDEDPVTRRRTFVAGRDGGTVTIRESGPLDLGSWTYDTRSGRLVGIGAQQRQGPATITIEAQITH